MHSVLVNIKCWRQGWRNKLTVYDFERSVAIGQKAFDDLKDNKIPTVPKFYDLWFTHLTGHKKLLSKAINDALADNSDLSIELIENIYDKFLCPSKSGEKVSEVGDKIEIELKDVLDLMTGISQSTGNYVDVLDGIVGEVKNVSSAEQLGKLLYAVVQATSEMAHNTKQLDEKLKDSYHQINDLNHKLREIRSENFTDELTRIPNRKRYNEFLKQSIENANRHQVPFCLVMVDIDHFKKFNDTYGHQIGDQVLTLVAQTLQSHISDDHLAARYGGEEFSIILPNMSIPEALKIADKIRISVMNRELYQKSTDMSLGKITISLGIANYRAGETGDALVERADKLLYQAKAEGRNKAIGETEDHSKLSDAC